MKYLASVRSCVIAVLLLILLAPHIQNETASASASSEETFLTRALQAYKWVMADATSTQHGLAWDLYNSKVEQTNNSLYDGTTGVLLFLLELYKTTNDAEVLENAKRAANHLLASVQTERSSGFYTGLAGMLYALNETFKLTKDAKYANGADDCYAQIKTGIEQKTIILYSGYDIISGLAGIGLALLYYAEEREDKTILDVARECGDALLDGAVAVPEGFKWFPSASYNKEMPNFSHGTSGIAYFLARLYEETEEQKYLDAATKGARYLISIANKSNDQCYIYHSNPGGTEMFYLGWCHGPSGTWRLFYQLYNITEDEEWLDWVKRSANSILTKEFYPKTKTSWVHNRGICCGDAGVAQFFYDLYLLFDEDIYSDKQDEINSVLISRVYRPDGTLTDVYDQNGYMQGGAGIGAWMLQMNAMQNGVRPHIWFPDR
ncbi:MAG: hypothetical protein MI702_09015, partial [Chlorobiales bacterium]|nr:hypothetical protein [Chlorobiales bacterium]